MHAAWGWVNITETCSWTWILTYVLDGKLGVDGRIILRWALSLALSLSIYIYINKGMGCKRKQSHVILPLQVTQHCPTGGPPRRPKLSLQICFHVSTPSIVQSTVFWLLHRVMQQSVRRFGETWLKLQGDWILKWTLWHVPPKRQSKRITLHCVNGQNNNT
jgi:hypothetical protein